MTDVNTTIPTIISTETTADTANTSTTDDRYNSSTITS